MPDKLKRRDLVLYTIYQSDNLDVLLKGFLGRFENPMENIPINEYEHTYLDNIAPIYIPDTKTILLEKTLEAIFLKHNRDDRPDRDCMHSLSMGDIVELNDRFYLVCAVGFRDITDNIVN